MNPTEVAAMFPLKFCLTTDYFTLLFCQTLTKPPFTITPMIPFTHGPENSGKHTSKRTYPVLSVIYVSQLFTGNFESLISKFRLSNSKFRLSNSKFRLSNSKFRLSYNTRMAKVMSYQEFR
jgi:hypothetical protein